MPPITRMNTKQRLSDATICNGTVHLTGQVGGDEATVAEQARTVLSKIDMLLAQAGSDKKHMLCATVYLKDMNDFDAFNEVWDAWMPSGHAPARTCVKASMTREHQMCEVTVVAVQK